MSRKLSFLTLSMFLALGFAFCWAQNNPDQQPNRQRGPAGPSFTGLIEQLEDAYKANDRDALGKAIEQLKQTRSRRGRGMGPEQNRPPRPAGDNQPPQTKSPLPIDDAEKKILTVLNDMKNDPNQRFANISFDDGRLLRQLTEATDAKRVVELGTSTGYSGIWFAMALKKTGGKLLTHEIDPDRAKKARNNFNRSGLGDVVTIIEGDAHETVKQHKDPIDIIFLDADKQGYIDYLNKLLPLVRPGGLIIAHNMRYPRADPDFVKAITNNPKLDTTYVLMEGAGMSITLKKR
ncbi:MAG: O-methyltransferase [Sedimentisphaerales bacterium]|nr:O-methyltransferase [Sedimentisphaerales bacterium]